MKENKYAYAMEIIKAIGENPDMVETIDPISGEWRTFNPYDIGRECPIRTDECKKWFRLKTTSKKVPLELSDIRPGMAIRHTSNIDWITIYAAYQVGIQTYRGDNIRTYSELMERWEYSLDGVTWHKCEKEAKG